MGNGQGLKPLESWGCNSPLSIYLNNLIFNTLNIKNMSNKTLIFTYFLFLSHYSLGQTLRGELSYVRALSTSYEDMGDLRFNEKFSDTISIEIDGIYGSKVINEKNYKEQYLHYRDSTIIYFDTDSILTVRNNYLYSLTNRNSELTSVYRYEYAQFSKISSYNISDYASKMKIEVYDVEIDKNDVKIVGGVEGYRLSYKELTHGAITHVKMYVSENIKFDTKILSNFKSPVKMCPIYIEETNPTLPKRIFITKLLNAKEVSKEFVAKKIQKIKVN